MMEHMKYEKKQLQDDSEDRKQHMQTMELKRMQNEKLSDLEQVRNVSNFGFGSLFSSTSLGSTFLPPVASLAAIVASCNVVADI